MHEARYFNKTVYVALSLLLIIGITYVIQAHLFLNWDVDYLLHVSNKLLAGGKYGVDIWETNPPMILYLYAPVSWFSKLNFLTLFSAFFFYMNLLALTSLACCFVLLNKIIYKQDNYLKYLIIYALAVVFFFMPYLQFGQREHIFVILIFPYLLASVVYLRNFHINNAFAIFIGIMAGLALSLKPFFLLLFIFIELNNIIAKRSILAWVRMESLICMGVMLVYLLCIFLFQRNYIDVMLPLISSYYFSVTRDTWPEIFSDYGVLLSLSVIIRHLILRNHPSYSDLSNILFLALIGMLCAAIIPRTPSWYYHILPALSFAFILLVVNFSLSFSAYKNKHNLTVKDNFIIGAALVLLALLVIGFLLNHGNFILGMLGLILILVVLEKLIFSNHFISAVLLMCVLCVFIILKEQVENIFVMGKANQDKLVPYINSLPHVSTLTCLSPDIADCFPLVDLTHKKFGFTPSWWLKGVVKKEKNSYGSQAYQRVENDKKFLLKSFMKDLKASRENVIIINTKKSESLFGSKLGMVDYFLQDENFREVWQHYHAVAEVGDYQLWLSTWSEQH